MGSFPLHTPKEEQTQTEPTELHVRGLFSNLWSVTVTAVKAAAALLHYKPEHHEDRQGKVLELTRTGCLVNQLLFRITDKIADKGFLDF